MIILIEKPAFDPNLIYSDNILFLSSLNNRSKLEALPPAEVIRDIQNGNFDTSPENFYAALQIAYNDARGHGHHLARRKFSSIQKMKTFKVFNYNAGFALTRWKGAPGYSEAVALFNSTGFEGIGKLLMEQIRRMGGYYLECFGGFLRSYYAQFGYEVYKELPGIKMPNGQGETLYFMKLKSAALPTIT
jgi:hypothetical protein